MIDQKDEFLELFLKNHASLFGFIISRGVKPDSAEDVLQNAATVLWQKFETYEKGTNFRAWAFSVTRIEVQRFLAGQKRDSRVIALDEETLESLERMEEEEHEGLLDFQKALLAECIEKLGKAARRILSLRYGDGLSFDEVAQTIKRSSAALRIQVHRIRRQLRDCVMARMRKIEV